MQRSPLLGRDVDMPVRMVPSHEVPVRTSDLVGWRARRHAEHLVRIPHWSPPRTRSIGRACDLATILGPGDRVQVGSARSTHGRHTAAWGLKRHATGAEQWTWAVDHGGVVTDEWHIRIEQRYLDNEAGAGARAKEQELAGQKGAARRFLERVFDPKTEDRSWRRGAEGEERVAAQLAALGDGWAVIHDLTIGRKGANLDHLVIGPAGVFALNTKNLTGKLTVYEHAILQNGHKTAFVPAALREVRTVQQRLSAAAGREVRAWSVLVVMGCEVEVRKPLANLTLVRARSLPRWLNKLPGGVLSAGEVLELERLARTPGTWLPGSSAAPPRATPPAVPPPPAAAPPSTAADSRASITVRRWKRYGKHRLYANGEDGVRLGYLEVESGEIVLEVADPAGTIAAQLRASHRALGQPPVDEQATEGDDRG
jgi:hypothetical protein